MRFIFALVLAGIATLWAAAVGAAPANLYKAEVIVASQSSAERVRASREGLAQVLVRASGDPQVVENPGIATAIKRAQSYVDQFAYGRGKDELGVTRETIVLSFTPSVVEQLLKEAGAQVWPANRPQVLLWMVRDTPEGGRELVNERDDPLVASVLAAASRRGLPVELPLLDLSDRIGAAVERVWEFDEEALLAASERYQAPVVMAARVVATGAGEVDLGWTLHHQGEWLSGQDRLPADTDVGAAIVGPAVGYLASLYAVAQPELEAGRQRLAIDGITTYAAFDAALDYLASLAQIARHQLIAAGPESLLLEVELLGNFEQLQNALNLDRKLEVVVPPLDAPRWQVMEPTDGVIRLRWAG